MVIEFRYIMFILVILFTNVSAFASNQPAEISDKPSSNNVDDDLIQAMKYKLMGLSDPENYKIAFSYAKKASDEGSIEADAELGDAYKNGEGVEKNIDLAVLWYQRALKGGNIKVRGKLRELYQHGDFIPKPDMNAGLWWQKFSADAAKEHAALILEQDGVKLNKPSSELNLALAYLRGIGIHKNRDAALNLLQQAVGHGNIEAQCIYEAMSASDAKWDMLSSGKAMTACLHAAKSGQIYAQLILGSLYENGHGVEADKTQADLWYRKAAEHGNTDAQVRLAYLLGENNYTGRDKTQSIYWYRKAAEHNNSSALLSLSIDASMLMLNNPGNQILSREASNLNERLKEYSSYAERELPDALWDNNTDERMVHVITKDVFSPASKNPLVIAARSGQLKTPPDVIYSSNSIWPVSHMFSCNKAIYFNKVDMANPSSQSDRIYKLKPDGTAVLIHEFPHRMLGKMICGFDHYI